VGRLGKYLFILGVVTLLFALMMTTVSALHQTNAPKGANIGALAEKVKQLAYSGTKASENSGKTDATVQNSAAANNSAATAASGQAEPKDAKDFRVYQNDGFLTSFASFSEAVTYAKQYAHSKVSYKDKANVVWSNMTAPADAINMDVERIEQMPELERGCEVTSLAMLLKSAGIDADKMKLASEVKKDPTEFEYTDDGGRFFGNPNDGFVGDIETFDKPGYGVYHGPIKELAETYMPNRIVDATGADFEDLFYFLNQQAPLWVIVNVDYRKLDDSDFERWDTPSGPIDITYKEHSVLVTGYDDNYIYFNDPLGETEKADRESFIEAWEQMGKQAISYVPQPAIAAKAG
jgi:uncharacterized protein YvpB